MTDIREFLTARLDEDEAAARAALPGPWQAYSWDFDTEHGVRQVDEMVFAATGLNREDADHIARWDPARVLAEVTAKRQIAAEHANGGELVPGVHFCTECGSGEPYEYPTRWPCATLRLLAAPYAEHPDFDPAWRTDA